MVDDPNTQDNLYKGSDVLVASNEEPLNLSRDVDFSGEDGTKWLYFRHKVIDRFEIPRGKNEIGQDQEPFAFKHGILRLNPNDLDEFLEAAAGMHRGDSINIVQIKNVQNEVPLQARQATPHLGVRGAASTSTINAPAIAPAGKETTKEPFAPRPTGGLGALLGKTS